MAHTVCVTGASGYVATELVKQLLEKGYHVRATLRNPADESKAGPLIRLSEALPGTLQLFAADLLEDGSFDGAIQGSTYVFHVASPFFLDAKNAKSELIDPAVSGTRNVLSSVIKFKDTISRVVVTSSVAAVKGINPHPPKVDNAYSEEDWNDTSTIDGEAYWLSKVLAERAAWELAVQHSIDLVTILPNFVMGPIISAASASGSTSIGFMKGILEGKAPNGSFVFVDVRDVARAHILAIEVPAAKGRYIVSQSGPTQAQELAAVFQERFPQFEFLPAEGHCGAEEKINNCKAEKELGLRVLPIRTTLIDMAVTMIQLGIAKPKEKK